MKSCEIHLVPNCPLCAKQTSAVVSPLTATNLPAPLVSLSPVATPPPEPKITDPTAQKMVAAANKYAQECEAVKTISEMVQNLHEVVAASIEKLKEAQANRDAAHKEMMQILNPFQRTETAAGAVKIQ